MSKTLSQPSWCEWHVRVCVCVREWKFSAIRRKTKTACNCWLFIDTFACQTHWAGVRTRGETHQIDESFGILWNFDKTANYMIKIKRNHIIDWQRSVGCVQHQLLLDVCCWWWWCCCFCGVWCVFFHMFRSTVWQFHFGDIKKSTPSEFDQKLFVLFSLFYSKRIPYRVMEMDGVCVCVRDGDCACVYECPTKM